MHKRFFEWSVWPLCIAANMALVVAAAILVPERLPQAASATTLVLMFVLIGLEQVLPYRPDWSVRGDNAVWRDVAHTVVYAVLAMNVSRFLFLLILAGTISGSGLRDCFGIWPANAPVWLQIVVVIVVGDVLEYFYHRLCHTCGFLWRVHAIHHTPVRMNTLKGGRHHFIYAFGRGMFVWLPLLLLGAPRELVYWQFITETITGLVGHANVRFRIPRFMHRLVVTPEFHRIHHAVDSKLGNSNFGVVFPFWDMVFDTHSDPLRHTVDATGIRDDPIPKQFIEEIRSPFTRS